MKRAAPMRMCIACREMKPKISMIRVVRTPDGEIVLDLTGKANGRGAYLCDGEDCMKKLVKQRLLNRVFSAPVDDAVYAKLAEAYSARK